MKLDQQLSIFGATQRFLLREVRQAYSLPKRKRMAKAKELEGRVRQLARDFERFDSLLKGFK